MAFNYKVPDNPNIPQIYRDKALSLQRGDDIDDVEDVVNEDLWHRYINQRHCYIEQGRGTGKSSAVKAVARRAGVQLAIVYLSMVPPEEVGGIPHAAPDGYFDRLRPGWMRGLHPGAIIFFDEINQASPETLNAIFSLCDSTPTFHGEPLPPVWVVAAGNLANENETLSTMPYPLRERIPKIVLDANLGLISKILNLSEEQVKQLLRTGVSPRFAKVLQSMLPGFAKKYGDEYVRDKQVKDLIEWASDGQADAYAALDILQGAGLHHEANIYNRKDLDSVAKEQEQINLDKLRNMKGKQK